MHVCDTILVWSCIAITCNMFPKQQTLKYSPVTWQARELRHEDSSEINFFEKLSVLHEK